MVAPDHSDAPDPTGIQMVVDAFKKHSIDLIIDPQHTAIPEHRVITFHTSHEPACAGPDAVDFFALKQQYFHQTHQLEHYAIFGYYSDIDPSVGGEGCRPDGLVGFAVPFQSGYAELPGTNFVVSLGFMRQRSLPRDSFRIMEAGTFMHELGHNLGLHHGGGGIRNNDIEDEPNYKPNYLSVMNYRYQFSGI